MWWSLESIDFEWNRAKSEANQRKHGVTFEVATQAFFDPSAVVEEDLFALHEERWTVIGRSDAGLLFVVFTERRNNVLRIISARLANPHERRRYRAV